MTTRRSIPLQTFEILIPRPQQLEVFGGPDFFPSDTGDELVAVCDSTGQRKTTYHWPYLEHEDAGLPEPLVKAINWGL